MYSNPWDIPEPSLTPPEPEKVYHCPICGIEWPETLYARGSYIIGCNECIDSWTPEEWEEYHDGF